VLVLTVPMRNGNPDITLAEAIELYVLTVPMRNGNIYLSDKVVQSHQVLTVPMRNGNSPDLLTLLRAYIGSYRTYEEWKRAA